ncbi:hypothetical protein ACHAWO_001110 [Cyclotella atomus]|uniref:UBA domain-containing protein n=1 Tax=Cyclotella atomus TaxID=382360 RepID=A0ABD3N0R0_9STRA
MSTVNSRAAEWIVQYLTANVGVFKYSRNVDGSLDLQSMNVKELKALAKEIQSQVTLASFTNPTGPIYSKPNSGAKKAEWVASVANALALNEVLDVVAPQPASAVAGAGGTTNSPHSSAQQSSTTKQSSREQMRQRAAAAAEARSSRLSPRKSSTTLTSRAIQYASSVAAAAAASAATATSASKRKYKSPPKRNSPAKKSSAKKSNTSTIESDEAMALRLQQQYFTEANASVLPTAPAAATSSTAPIHANNSYRHYPYATGRKRPHNSPNKPIKVKAEPISPTRSSSVDDSIQPRDFKESSMVESLRNMGFTDVREMLSGIRATTDNQDGIFVPNQSNQQQQVEAAMMWIVNQREEAAEAAKLDEARISSEMADKALEQSRKVEAERQMKLASLNSLFGSMGEKSTTASITSQYFPHSVLLENVEVRKVMHAIGSGPGKDTCIKLLQLESKARKWYGTVLPYAHFKHVLCPCFETWSNEFIVSSKNLNSVSSSVLIQKVSNKSNELERGMYNLSNQEQGSFGMAPKLFLEAKRDAEAKGLPIGDVVGNGIDADVMIVQPSVRCSTLSRSCDVDGNDAEVIEIF